MRRGLLLSAIGVLFFLQTLTAFGADAAPAKACDLIKKIHEFVSEQTTIAFYGGSAAERKDKIAQLKAKYGDVLGKLKDLAAKDKGDLAKVQEALTKYESNVTKCSECEHQFRVLDIDLITFEQCRIDSCKPMDEARGKIGELAWKCKKGK